MKAIGNNIIITPVKVTGDKTKGGLLLVKKDREDIRYIKATIQSVGDLCSGLKAEDEIFYDRHAGHRIEVDGSAFQVIKMQDVVFVL